MGYHHRPARRRADSTLELAITVFVLAVLIATVVLFLFVYHDFPLRVS